MNIRSLSLLLLLVVLASSGFAQGFHIGVKGGANLYKISGTAFKSEFDYGYTAGLFAEIKLAKHWALQPEVLWNQSVTHTTDDFRRIYHTTASELLDIKLNYLTIPLLLSYRPSKFITLQAGPQYGLLINQSQDLVQNGKNAFKSGDLSLLSGLQFNIGGLKVGGRYVVGVTNINNVDNREPWRNHGFQLYAGFRII